ncbi:MAG TPA: glycosyltransferase family 39 protein, partial [Kofleriaceae bacterium]|nr:glycosyltransferase family 39 protein [Kofleriaceae bacterium]
MSSLHPIARSRLPSSAVIVGVVVLCRLPSFFRVIFDDDEAQYAAIGALVRAGGRLYQDGGVDFKPPGIYWTYACVFELAGRYAMWAVHLLALGVVAATACLLARIAERIATPRAGTLAGVFYGVFTTVYYPKMLAANTEIFMMLGLSAMTLLVLRARDASRWLGAMAAAGALVAIASAYKQSSVANALVIVAGVIGTRRWFARLAAAGAGCSLALGLGALVVAATSTLSGMWHWSVTRMIATHTSNAWQEGAVWHNVAVGLLPFVASSLVLWIAGLAAALRCKAWRVAERIVWVWLAISLLSSF